VATAPEPPSCLGPLKHQVRRSPLGYDRVLGEGSTPVPLPPSACPRQCVLRANLLAIKPNIRSHFQLNSELPLGSASILFSERPVPLRSSGLYQFSTVREIRTFRVTYVSPRKAVLRILSNGRERLISNLSYRGSNPPASARQCGARRLYP